MSEIFEKLAPPVVGQLYVCPWIPFVTYPQGLGFSDMHLFQDRDGNVTVDEFMAFIVLMTTLKLDI